MAVVVLKALDWMGLVPLRWALAILITPKVAKLIGPHLDRAVASIKRVFTGSKGS